MEQKQEGVLVGLGGGRGRQLMEGSLLEDGSGSVAFGLFCCLEL